MAERKLVITEYKHGILTFLTENSQFLSVQFCPGQAESKIGDIFIAKVSHIVKNIQSAFITYQKGKTGYLSLQDIKAPVLLNRKYDGRILEGDELLVQMDKEGIRTKDPVFTTNLSLAGKYCVITNVNLTKGVSTKIPKIHKELLSGCIPSDCPYGVIVRTNAAELIDKGQLLKLEEEIRLLSGKMTTLLTQGIHRTCYSKVYEEVPEYVKTVRDEQPEAYQSVVTDIPEIYEQLQNYFSAYDVSAKEKLSLYTDSEYSLSKLFRVETRMNELLSKKVWLKSGAYLVIEQTEAMYVIDVNSGKNISKKHHSDVCFQMNREAAAEIMNQVRLRNLSGMILIDFINMENQEQEMQLFNEMKMLAKKDPINTTVVDITTLGIMEMTRKKTKKSLSQQLSIDFSKTE